MNKNAAPIIIAIIGPPAVGKSAVLQLLENQANVKQATFRRISLDDYRRELAHVKDPEDREEQAQQRCREAINAAQAVLFETTGASVFWDELLFEWAGVRQVHTILLDASDFALLARDAFRKTDRTYQAPPTPWGGKYTFRESLQHCRNRYIGQRFDAIVDANRPLKSVAKDVFNLVNHIISHANRI